jgi:hypothetical protein
VGETAGVGALAFSWVPVTKGSSVDNLRPIVPLGDDKHRCCCGCAAATPSAQDYQEEVVGMIVDNP